MNVWITYESEKKKLQAKCLTPDEYDRAIAEIVRRLRI
jgi:hypothetical protein